MEVLDLGLGDTALRGRYDALFESCPHALVQQSSYWAEAIAPLGPDRPILLLASEGDRDVAGLPLYLYEHRLGNLLTSVPQPGPLGGVFVREDAGDAVRESAYASLLERALALARDHDCLALTVISHPFRDDAHLYRSHLEPSLILENFTQFVPIREVVVDGRIVLPDYNRRSNLSRNLRRAREAGLTVERCRSAGDFDAWYAVHERRHRELGLEPLGRELLDRLRSGLEKRGKGFLLLVRSGREVVAGCLHAHHGCTMDAYIQSMDARWADRGPNFLTTEQALLEAAQLGVEAYNWQSSVSREDGVYLYKRRWGSREVPYFFLTWLLPPVDRVLRLDPETVRREYPGHYVVPFAAFSQGIERRVYRK